MPSLLRKYTGISAKTGSKKKAKGGDAIETMFATSQSELSESKLEHSSGSASKLEDGYGREEAAVDHGTQAYVVDAESLVLPTVAKVFYMYACVLVGVCAWGPAIRGTKDNLLADPNHFIMSWRQPVFYWFLCSFGILPQDFALD